jgi:polysaccharide export outer membrane protein
MGTDLTRVPDSQLNSRHFKMHRLLPREILVLFGTLSLGAACGHVPQASAVARRTNPEQEYRIQPGDQLDIKFYFSPELNEAVTVRPDGRISLQLVRDVNALGLTPNQLTDRLTQLFQKDLINPRIAVIVRSFSRHRVFVDGEVNKAGLLALVGPMTVTQAISQAGGMRDTANPGSIIVIRREVDAKPIIMTVDIDKVFDGSDLSEDVPLRPSDIVYVPKSGIANVNQWVDQYIRKNIPVPVYIPLPVPNL